MTAFSREKSKDRAITIKQRRARTMAKQQKPEMKIKHADWCKDADKGIYTVLNQKVKEECQKAQLRTEKYRSKLHEVKT